MPLAHRLSARLSIHLRTPVLLAQTPQSTAPAHPRPRSRSRTSATMANAWASPGPAEFDFRSDVVTTPTSAMLAAIANTTLLDDVFRSDPTTNGLESLMASLTGHPAALFVLSGTMANQLALRAHLGGPPHAVLADHRAHIFNYEAGGLASLSGAFGQPVVPAGSGMLTLDDVRRAAVVEDEGGAGSVDVHAAPTRVVVLENTLDGEVLGLAEVRRIAAWARPRGLLLHCDGARLWEAVVRDAGGRSAAERGWDGDVADGLRAYCAPFDSIGLCFSKGLGAPCGSVLVGSDRFVQRARHVRKSIGGGLRQAGVLTAAARVAVEETFLGGRLPAAQARAAEAGRRWVERGGVLARRVETNMVWLHLEAAGVTATRLAEVGREFGLELSAESGRLVVHYQISDEAMTRLTHVFDALLKPTTGTPHSTAHDIPNGSVHHTPDAKAANAGAASGPSTADARAGGE